MDIGARPIIALTQNRAAPGVRSSATYLNALVSGGLAPVAACWLGGLSGLGGSSGSS